MPRNKNAARRGKASKFSRGGRGGRSNGFDSPSMSYEESSTSKSHKDFTLQDEARNTERHHSFWNNDQRLRHSKVNFISAGKLETQEEGRKSEDQDENESALAKMSLGSVPKETLQGRFGHEESPLYNSNPPDDTAEGTIPLSFILDTVGTTPINTSLPSPHVRATSPTPSNSSEEIILFRGRDRNGRSLSKEPKRYYSQARVIDEKIKIVENKIQEKEALLEEALHVTAIKPPPSTADALDCSSIEMNQRIQRSDRSYGRRIKGKAKQANEDALYADYIANMASEDNTLQSSPFKLRELGGSDDNLWLDQREQSSDEATKNPKAQAQGGWDSSDLHDFDAVSTSGEFSREVVEVLSKQEHKSGPKYLVVLENQSVDDARWIPASAMTTSRSLAQIQTFEREAAIPANIIKEVNDSTGSDSIDEDFGEDDEEDEIDDEEELVQRKINQVSDEKIAQLLSKQEELGMGSIDLLLFDDASHDNEVVEDSEDAFFSRLLAQNRSKPKSRGMKRPQGKFPAAHALADAYDGFDVMDFDRPSLKKKPKGRKGKLVFDLSDSELEASMQMAWDNDRIKKKERKQEREELRSQGLLGNKNDTPDLKGKYKEGMGIHAVKEEIKNFLMSSHTTLSLPPMDKADRKVIHEIANAFKLKSKSMGFGKTRFPILYRTSRTSIYAEGKFAAVEARLMHRFLPRMDVSGRKSGGRSRGFGNAAVSYQDGDIVGGSAPELGIENKGRAMLEKMGWSTGTALGAINNKGILQPVSHVVKTTKAGLG
ncbi:hypothetical protein BGZ60DRAFT_433175 [Tricladium varicosporioides]|nr:hypothetical protein BGZ60DRAFT_433175 [Hymenoscyphus varicosporioides]